MLDFNHMISTRIARPSWLGLALAAAMLLGLLAGSLATVSAHDTFRLVGTVSTWDAKKSVLTITTKETQDDGTVKDVPVSMSISLDTVVMRLFKKVPLSELKPGVFVVIDAAGVDKEIEASEIEIIPPQPKPAPKPVSPVKKP